MWDFTYIQGRRYAVQTSRLVIPARAVMIDGMKDNAGAGGVEATELRIRLATSIAEVLQLVNEFVRELDAEDLASLPLECRPREFTHPVDLSNYAFEVKRFGCRTSGGILPGSRRLMEVATAAASQIALLYRREEMARRVRGWR